MQQLPLEWTGARQPILPTTHPPTPVWILCWLFFEPRCLLLAMANRGTDGRRSSLVAKLREADVEAYIAEKMQETMEETAFSTRPPSSLEASTRPGTRLEGREGWCSPELMTAWTQDIDGAFDRATSPGPQDAERTTVPPPLLWSSSPTAGPPARTSGGLLLPSNFDTLHQRPHTHAKNRGMPVRVGQVGRQDTLPCRQTGRRQIGAADEKVRVYVYFPTTGDKMSLWVEPDLKIGPSEPTKPNRFNEFWGEHADRDGYSAGRGEDALAKVRTRASTAVKQLVTQTSAAAAAAVKIRKQASMAVAQKAEAKKKKAAVARVGPEPLAEEVSPTEEDSLKTRIFKLTGIKPRAQHLMFDHSLVEMDNATLRSYGIGHGMTLSLRIDERLLHSAKPPLEFLATTKAKEQRTYSLEYVVRRKADTNRFGAGEFRMMPKWVTSFAHMNQRKVVKEFDSIWTEPLAKPATTGGGQGDIMGRLRVKLGIL